MADYECYYDVKKEYDVNDGCNIGCAEDKCACDGGKIITIYIKTKFAQFYIEYDVLSHTHKQFIKALEYWNINKTHFNFPGMGAHSLSYYNNLWYLESFKSDGGHAPQYSRKLNLSNPDKIISVFKQVCDILS